MIELGKITVEQKFVTLDCEGHSNLLEGDYDSARTTKNVKDLLPSYLNIGWKVANLTPFSGVGKILVLLEKEIKI